jgi:hemoglobin/transferrin/lactoferrin receptor protein
MYSGVLSQVQSIQNASEARVWGLQADFELKFLNGFELSSRVNYQKGEEELDNGSVSPLRHASPLFGIASLSYSAKKLLILFFVNYNGQINYSDLAEEERGKPHIYATDTDGNPYSPSWYTLNFRAQYKINKNFSVSADFENITDQRYRTYSSGMISPGMNFIIGAKVNF